MTEKKTLKTAASPAKSAPKTKKTAPKRKAADSGVKKPTTKADKIAKAKAPVSKTGKAKAEKVVAAKAKAKPAAERAPERAAKAGQLKPKAPEAKARKAKAEKGAAGYRVGKPVLDPIGDTTDGEGRTYTAEAELQAQREMAAFRAETTIAAMDAGMEAGPGLEAVQTAAEARARRAAEVAATQGADAEESDQEEAGTEPRGPKKLERLQKILSQAGIASRRHAEEMIVAGRVMVNGKLVTQLGSKADRERDHIRVDGKLLHGAERHRYFVLNKPKGYVTTVSDPEGRPTVMEFFAKMGERLYPVGRLDYLSEGLLLMTNDGELANLLTKAGSGVEKTYLVKVAGQPSEEELERLRGGVTIDRGEAGSPRVRTAPARVKQVREGDNPWYEVVLIEGRNRELRKMFSAVGHFVEKIRRVGYGPLVLDVEPGNLRELTAEEVAALRLTAEGKMKPRRAKTPTMLTKGAVRPPEKRFEKTARRQDNWTREKRFDGPPRGRGGEKRFDRPAGRGGKPEFGGRREDRPFSGPKPGGERRDVDRPRFEKPGFSKVRIEQVTGGPGDSVERPKFAGQPRFEGGAKFEGRSGFKGRKPFTGDKKPFGGGRPAPGVGRTFNRPRFDRPKPGGPGFSKPRFEKPGFEKRGFDRPRFDKPGFEKPAEDRGDRKPGGFGARPYFKPGGAPKRPFGSGPEKRFEKGPAKSWPERRDSGPRAGTGGQERPGGAFRGKSWTGRSADSGAGRPKPAFGGRPGGFAKPDRPGGGERPGGFVKRNKPGGFKRPNSSGGAKRGGSGFGRRRPEGR
ncbi:MAG: pseudouridine synthase [Terracidiphilus sp.]